MEYIVVPVFIIAISTFLYCAWRRKKQIESPDAVFLIQKSSDFFDELNDLKKEYLRHSDINELKNKYEEYFDQLKTQSLCVTIVVVDH